MDTSNMPQPVEGSLVHIEFAVSSTEAARKFYGELFGWTFNEWGDTSTYLLFMDGGNKFGGGFSTYLEPSGDKGALAYIYTADIEAKLALIGSAGGSTITGKSEIPGVGWYAVFADPFGNHVGLYSSN